MEKFEYNIIIVGNKNVGKTSFINNFLEKKLDLQENSIGISYSFGKLVYQNKENLIHAYEVNKDFNDIIIDYINNLKNVIIFFLYEIKENQNLHKDIITNINFLKKIKEKIDDSEFFKKFYNLDNLNNLKVINDKIPVYNILNKYDEFKKLSIDKREQYCKMLRSYSIIMGASLLTYSKIDNSVSKKVKEIIHFSLYNRKLENLKVTEVDYFIKPFYIKFGNDKLENLNIKITNNFIESLKNIFNDVIFYDEKSDIYNEEIIDLNKEDYKNEELDKEIENFNKKKIINYI